MSRTPLTLTASLAALTTAAIIATSGSAQVPAPTSLHFVETAQNGVGFQPHGQPGEGDRFGFGNRVRGSDTGISRGLCTFIGTGKNQRVLCTDAFQLSRGTLILEAIFSGAPNHSPGVVVGGTGAYKGARGTAVATELSRTKTDTQITLLP